jgi:polysaccharide deacetylase family protein (PEP-CTERM system associated)
MINALCVDVEYWWCNEFLTRYLPEKREDQIVESVTLLLDLLDKYRIKATFFVLGIVAEKHPEIVREIYNRGHEVASHAYSHKTLYKLGRDNFKREVEQSLNCLKSIIGQEIRGFRSPSFSLNESTRWALEVLVESGFDYDASIFPFKTNLYGVLGVPLHPYRPSYSDLTREDTNSGIIEFPMTVLRAGIINIPIAGGFYFRVLPLWFVKWALRKVNKERPAIFYIHPWEVYDRTPRLRNIPWFSRFVTYYGTGRAFEKFESLLQEFSFAPVREVLGNYFKT